MCTCSTQLYSTLKKEQHSIHMDSIRAKVQSIVQSTVQSIVQYTVHGPGFILSQSDIILWWLPLTNILLDYWWSCDATSDAVTSTLLTAFFFFFGDLPACKGLWDLRGPVSLFDSFNGWPEGGLGNGDMDLSMSFPAVLFFSLTVL